MLEIRESFSNSRVEVSEEEQGGAYVIVHDVDLGGIYSPPPVWCGFLITFQYPHADVYPHFFGPSLTRIDGAALGESFSGAMQWRDKQCVQVSRRSNRLDPQSDTAATKLLKVLDWVRSR